MLQFIYGLISRLISNLSFQKGSLDTSDTQSSSQGSPAASSNSVICTIPWGAKVSQTFRDRIVWCAEKLGVPVDFLMAVIAFESAESFRSDIKNFAGSGATGLIQFMPATALSLGITVEQLALMTPEDQLTYVYKYFLPYRGRLKTLSDVYMAVLWPRAIGKPENYVLWNKATQPKTYRQNAGLDLNVDEEITKAEAAHRVQQALIKGRNSSNIWTGEVFPYGKEVAA